MDTSIQLFEYEERAFLEEPQFFELKQQLEAAGLTHEVDNKTSYFFVLPDINLSIAASAHKTVVKYKSGQLARGNGFEEHEFALEQSSLPEALRLFTALLGTTPQLSEQFRINYKLGGGIEIALKYTQTWGFHAELEKLYPASSQAEQQTQRHKAKQELTGIAKKFSLSIIADDEMEAFKQTCATGVNRGHYTAAAFRAVFGDLFA